MPEPNEDCVEMAHDFLAVLVDERKPVNNDSSIVLRG